MLTGYRISWKFKTLNAITRYSGLKAYSINGDEEAIKQEIYENGPVEGAFSVYEDFVSYKAGKSRDIFR